MLNFTINTGIVKFKYRRLPQRNLCLVTYMICVRSSKWCNAIKFDYFDPEHLNVKLL